MKKVASSPERHKMKTIIAIAFVLATTSVLAYDDNPTSQFDATHNMTNKTKITWKAVSNVQAECNKESKRLAGRDFGYAVLACSFWERENGQDVCTIITGTRTSMHSIGHEMRHCFQGNWHD